MNFSFFNRLWRFPLKQTFSYTLDGFMSRGGGAILMILLLFFLVAFSSLTFLRIVAGMIWHDENLASLSDQVWRVVLQIGLGGMGQDTDNHFLNKIVGLATVIAGMVFFSSLVAFITGLFNTKIRELRKGKSLVLEKNHTLILGMGGSLIDVVSELILAYESEKQSVIVILSDHPKETMDGLLKEKIKDFKKTTIVTRTGNVTSRYALERVNAMAASSIILLNPIHPSASSLEKERGDSQILKSLMALISLTGNNTMLPTIAQIHSARNRELAEGLGPDKIQTLDDMEILSRILVQTSISTGLAEVYSNLVGFEGNEIYFFAPPNGWMDHSFGKLQFHFIQSILLGFSRPDGTVLLNPPPHYVPMDDDIGILFAEDDSTIHFYHNQVIEVEEPQFFIKKTLLTVENQLLIGWSSKIESSINEFSQYMADRSSIHIVVEALTEPIQQAIKGLQQDYPHLTIDVMERDIHDFPTIQSLEPHKYNSIIFLAEDQENSDQVDSITLKRLLRFRSFFKKVRKETGQPITTKLVTEVMEVENAELIMETGARDFIIPHRFGSKILAQLSQEPQVKKIYDKLFHLHGCHIYVKPANLYFEELPITKSFANCMKAAQMRGEVCFGLRLAQSDNLDSSSQIHLLPYKNEIFDLREGDGLITLAHQRS